MFTDSFAPAEWSFSTYMRPTLSGSATHTMGTRQHAVTQNICSRRSSMGSYVSAKDYDRAIGGTGFQINSSDL